MRTALVTGITGQDGGYLAERLLAAGYSVHGLVRPGDLEPVDARVVGHTGDLADGSRLAALVAGLRPDVIVNLGGLSSVAASWRQQGADRPGHRVGCAGAARGRRAPP